MIAAEHKTVLDAAQDRLHAETIRLDARRARVVKATAMNRAPEVCVELEVSAAPIALHGAKKFFEVLLHFRMSAVEHVPWTTSPAAKGDAIRSQRRAVRIFHEPVGVLLKHMRLFFRDERRDPDRWFETTLANLFEHALHVAAESGASLEPVAHGRLVAVVDLHVTQTGGLFGDEVEIVEDLLRRDARAEAVPRTPARRRRGKALRWMIGDELRREIVEQLFASVAGE